MWQILTRFPIKNGKIQMVTYLCKYCSFGQMCRRILMTNVILKECLIPAKTQQIDQYHCINMSAVFKLDNYYNLMTIVTSALMFWVNLSIRAIICMARVRFLCRYGFHATQIIIVAPQKNLHLAGRHFAVCLHFLMNSIHISSSYFRISGLSNYIF